MRLRWLNGQRFDASRPASGRLPATTCRCRTGGPRLFSVAGDASWRLGLSQWPTMPPLAF